MIVLTINAGSSSIRLAAMDAARGAVRQIAACQHQQPMDGMEAPLRDLLDRLGGLPVDAVAHRVVHGGEQLSAACLIDAQVESEIRRLAPLAPLHNPAALAWMQAARTALGAEVPQVAVFDTAFYARLPAVASHYALPRELSQRLHLRRFGFHGLAHQGMVERWHALHPDAPADARLISLQLGSGCSITATRGGSPLDTSMGFSPLEGLMMATRCGDLDPGLLLYLQRELSLTPDATDHLLNAASGLLGVSASSSDMRILLASDDAAAQLAVDMYCYRARKYLGAYLAVLGGVDAILFGGGVGENAPAVRERILDGFQWAGIHLDAAANRRAVGIEALVSPVETTPSGSANIWTLPVDEATLLAREALRAISRAQQEEHHHA